MRTKSMIILALALFALAAAEPKIMGYPYDGADSFPNTLTLPAGSDLKNVSTVDVPFEALADRTKWLLNRNPNNTTFLFGDNTNSGGDPVIVESFDNAIIANAWTKSTVIMVDIPSCLALDVLLCRLHVGQSLMPAAKSFSFRLYRTDDLAGTPSDGAVPYSHGGIRVNDANEDRGFESAGQHIVTADGTTRIGLEIRPSTVGSWQLDIYSGIYLECSRLRA